MKPGLSKKVVVAAVLGNALEFYDFAAYAFFAVYIGQAFFPASTPFASLLLSLGVFGVGFVFRPLGGVLIGAFADSVRPPASDAAHHCPDHDGNGGTGSYALLQYHWLGHLSSSSCAG